MAMFSWQTDMSTRGLSNLTKNGNFIRIIGGVKGSAPERMQLVHGVVID
jgi:hypothetical protein